MMIKQEDLCALLADVKHCFAFPIRQISLFNIETLKYCGLMIKIREGPLEMSLRYCLVR